VYRYMTSPFRFLYKSKANVLAVTEAFEDLEATANMEALFNTSFSDQLDKAVYALTKEAPTTPFSVPPVIPDYKRRRYSTDIDVDGTTTVQDSGTDGRVGEVEQLFAAAREAIRQVCESPTEWPVSATDQGEEIDPFSEPGYRD